MLFALGISSAQVMESLADGGARLVEINAAGDLAVVAFNRPSRACRLYRHGSLLVGGADPAGCSGAISATAAT